MVRPILPGVRAAQADTAAAGVIGKLTTSNHIMEVEKVLGIEAARKCIVNEIEFTMTSHGLGVDWRHLMLLGDVMCFKVCRALSSVLQRLD